MADATGSGATENSTETSEATSNDAQASASGNMIEATIADKNDGNKSENLFDPNKLGILNDVSILLTIEVGRAQIKIRDLLSLTKGSVIELNKLAGDPVDVYANGKLISIGNIITANGKYCVRLTSIPENNKIGVPSDGK
jgi:flagellar motor switch protein FliN/FliY